MKQPDYTDFADIEVLNENFEVIDREIKEAKDAATDVGSVELPELGTDNKELTGAINEINDKVTQHLDQYEYQTAVVSGTQIQLEKQSNSNRLLFKLESELTGNITVSTDGGETSKNLVDVDGVQITSLDKGFHEIVAAANFFILRNKGGLSKADLEALITIVNEAESNESVLRTNYINAVNSADSTINLPNTASWNDVLLQIPNINSSNIRVATGTKTSGTNSFTFQTGSGTDTTQAGLTFANSDIPFRPRYIIMFRTDGSLNYPCFWSYENYTDRGANDYGNSTIASGVYRVPYNENSFNIPVSGFGASYEWIAFE